MSERKNSNTDRPPRKASFGGLGAPLGMSRVDQPESSPAPSVRSRSSSTRSSLHRRPSIDPARLGAMTPLTPREESINSTMQGLNLKGDKYNVLYIGAGNINFGSEEGPWNHSVRLEHKLQKRLNVVGIVDPNTSRGQAVLDIKRASFVETAYANCGLYKSLSEFAEKSKPEEAPHAVIIGSPAQFHGSTIPGQDLELECLKYFPKTALFIEKPISCAPVPKCFELAKELEKRGTVASVGYMLRYLKVIQNMHQIIQETGKPVMMVVARYVCSYAKIKSEVWWNKSKSLGPIVEQGTHLVDLCRYFGGEAILESVQATSTEHYEEVGQLEAIPIDESKIPDEDRIPRTTSALWKFQGGGICSFTHALTLQGTKYSTELEVYLDGWQLKVVDLYSEPTLFVRSPESDAEQRINFNDDDPYFGEISAWLDASENPLPIPTQSVNNSAIADDDDEEEIPEHTPNGILSTFRDACNTYALTHAIKEASEKALKTPRFE